VLDLALAPLHERLAQLRRQADEQIGENAVESAPAQRLGLVTVMFVDVVGSTALGGKLDPEGIHLVMDPALARFTDIVRRCHGRALQFAGDSMLAAFGTEGAREDDAELAVTAGLAILREAQVLAERVRREHRHPGFNVRVGLHTGPVLLGGGVDADNSIRGATVNLAARMEQNTAPGTLRITEDTQRAVQGLFDLDEQPPLLVKGYEQPMRTWLATRRRALRQAGIRRGVAGVNTPLVGREAAMQTLQSAWKTLHEGPAQIRTVSISAEAGLGKTRLAHAWADWAREQGPAVRWLPARAQARNQALPYALLRDLLATALQLPDDDTPAAAREHWVVAVRPLLQGGRDDAATTADAQVLGHLLGLDFADSPALRGILKQAAQIRQRGLQAAAELLAGLGEQGRLPGVISGVISGVMPGAVPGVVPGGTPLVMVLEDAQWADSGSLDFLRRLPQHPATTGLRLLLLLLTRPELAERLPNRGAGDDATGNQAAYQTVDLAPLDEAASHRLAQALLAPLQPPAPALQALLVSRAAGNPFYMEELLQMLLAQGVIAVQASTDGTTPSGEAAASLRWSLRTLQLDATALPTTLTGVLQARLQALAPAERNALQLAAVLGQVFRAVTLAALAPEAAERLAGLAQRGLLHLQATAVASAEATYAFSHAFVQQVAYGQLLRGQRLSLHGQAARWYAGQTHALAADDLPLAADHFTQAGDTAEALQHRLLAAERLAKRFAHEAVQDQASLGLALDESGTSSRSSTLNSSSTSTTRWRLLLLRQRARRQSGQREAQAQDLQAMADLAERTADPVQLATVAVRRAVAADEMGQSRTAAMLAPLGLAAAQQAQDSALELIAYGVLCGSLRSVGRHDEAQQAGEQGLARAKAVGDPIAEAEMLGALAAIAAEQSAPLRSMALLRRALHLYQSNGNRHGECMARNNLGTTALQLGDTVAAERDYDQAAQLARHLGNPNFEVMSLLNRASARLPQARLPEARADAEAAVVLAQRVANTEYEAFALITRGAVDLAQAQEQQPADGPLLAQAQADWLRSAELLNSLELPHLAIEAVAWQARGFWVGGDAAAALQCVEQVLAHVQQAGNLDGTENPLLIQSTCIEVLTEADDARAKALLQTAWQDLQTRCTELPDDAARERFMRAQSWHQEIQLRALAAGLA